MTDRRPLRRALHARGHASAPFCLVAALYAVATVTSACLMLSLAGCRGGRRDMQAVRPAAAAQTDHAAPMTVKPEPEPRRFWLAAVGDIMLDRGAGYRIRTQGVHSILQKVKDQTDAATLSFGNLECPLSETGSHSPFNCIFRADPEAVQVLVDGGFDVVSLANNHTFDAGRKALSNTFDCLEKNGIAYVGAGREDDKGCQPVIFETNGPDVAFLACTDLPFEHRGQCKIGDEMTEFCAHVESVAGDCDLLFVSVHWGHEYHNEPSPRQKKVGRALIEAGADCILGHHPHVLQGIEVHQGRPILYSMGNFVFDQREAEHMETAIFDIWWKEPDCWQIKATPVWISRSRMGPEYAGRERAAKIARRLRDLSRDLGTEAAVNQRRTLVRITGDGEHAAALP